ncbi:MBL fold metallo-hydrolase [Halobellus captivus]|uniref:MBL fold metallo-hydrolase n=1 Tax=Halobellus captivus TaxID=2592614 RepID=UPI0011A854A4|nr:MBL fold metallo-hydrolase [Halobellus captivus]
MKTTLLGTANPIPTLDRAGNAIVVEVAGEPYLVDCGPRTVYELLRNEIDPGDVENLLFTHHHMDHNLSFFHLAIVGWTAGRESLEIYGPTGTDDLVDGLYSLWEEDIAYRQEAGYPAEGIENIATTRVSEGFELETDEVHIETLPVQHSIETYGYKFTEKSTGATTVLSSDTAKFDGLSDFAAGANALVMTCGIVPVGETPEEGFVWERYTEPYEEERRSVLLNYHVTPTQAGEIAADAGVDTLVLTHFTPYPDRDAIEAEVAEVFDGEVVAARDGCTVSV